MKLKFKQTIITTIVFFTYGTIFCCHSCATASALTAEKPLNIIVGSTIGNKSHAIPMLEIIRELIKRGHQITFVSNDQSGEWATDQPTIKQVFLSAGPNGQADKRKRVEDLFVGFNYIDLDALDGSFYKIVYADYEKKLVEFRRLLLDSYDGVTADLAMCDFICVACIDAAYELDIPFVVITMSTDYAGFSQQPYLPYRPGTLHASMEHAAFMERAYNTIYAPIRKLVKTWDGLNYQKTALQKAGAKLYSGITERYDRGLVIVYTFAGFELPRPLQGNVFYAGPLLAESYPALTTDVEQFFQSRSKVIYVGFGGMTPLSGAHFELLTRAFLAAHKAGLIDGVLWGLMLTDISKMPQVVDENDQSLGYISADSGNPLKHHIEDMLNGNHPFIKIMQRAPQRAVLEHPAVRAFVSHCGLTSIHEAMMASTPVLCIPGFGDQPMNALRLEHLGAGEKLFWTDATVDRVVDKLNRLLSGNSAQRAQLAMQRLNKMAVLASRRVPMAADMVEMAAIPGALQLLEPASERMAWWRANNADIWLFIVLVSSAIVMFLYYGCRRMFTTKQSNITPQAKHLSYKAHTE
ncbi:hypothetical protein BDF19DRAFT_470281 [Syncephalis fuscata]|nr:hypothetical protein BDF19DRAFT_470281 [Syncephalis fuscata]